MAGPSGFFKGLTARVLYAMPATAICWSTYEFAKFILSRKSREDYQSSVSTVMSPTPKKVMASAADRGRLDDAGKIGLHYVLPTTSAETNFDAVDNDDATATTPAAPPPVREPTSIIPRELPSMSGAGVYASLSLNTMHNPSDAHRSFDGGCNR